MSYKTDSLAFIIVTAGRLHLDLVITETKVMILLSAGINLGKQRHYTYSIHASIIVS